MTDDARSTDSDRSTSRRAFLKAAGGLAAAAGLFRPGPLTARQTVTGQEAALPAPAPEFPLVTSVQGPLAAALPKALEPFGGMAAFVKPGATVVLKPNASFPTPRTWGCATSPELVRAVAEEALKAGAGRVLVVDNTMRPGTESFDRTGLTETLASMENVKLFPIQEEKFFVEVPVPEGRALKSVRVARLAQKADALINLPCAKSHSATGVSFGLKNLMGLVWDRGIFHTGADIHTAIADLATVLRPHLTILDATRALVTGGPTGPGRVVSLNTLVAGVDPLAVDATAVGLATWNNRTLGPDSVLHLAAAGRLGLGEIDPARIRLLKSGV
jgi:uncharacterized protein (DUF362 family)